MAQLDGLPARSVIGQGERPDQLRPFHLDARETPACARPVVAYRSPGARLPRVFDAALDPEWGRYLVHRAVTEVDEPIIVRVTVFDPGSELAHPGADAVAHVLVTTRPAPQEPQRGLCLRSARYRREMPEVKHVGLFGSLGLRRLAQRDGFDDVAIIDESGTLSDVATSNLGFVVGDRVLWPDAVY